METLATQIILTINETKNAVNTNLYHLRTNTEQRLGDESGNSNTIWDRWDTSDESDESDESDSELTSKLSQLIANFINKDRYFEYLHNGGLSQIIQSPKGDLLQLHYCDHSIHLYTFHSGQY
jgi:hypothetical protein